MTAYYNEWEPYPAQWLRNLIAENLIAPGDVDERSIKDVKADDLKGYTQCHFFAGIGGWSYALRLAGWPDERPVWTGSCPCQPFSEAGKRKGTCDERHLWPDLYRLICECQPSTFFGEQIAAKDGLEWLAGVRNDLEASNYAVGCADICAASVSAPHKRQRVWWVGHTNSNREKRPRAEECFIDAASQNSRLGNSTGEQIWDARLSWRQSDTVKCSDGKTRRIESGTFPLANGVPARMDKIRAYGNAIVPQVAQAFIEAFMECRP